MLLEEAASPYRATQGAVQVSVQGWAAKGSTSSGSAKGFAKRPHHRCLKTASPLLKGLARPRDLGQDRRPRLGVLGTDLGHGPRPRLGVLGTDLGHDRRPLLGVWLSGGPGCRRRVRHHGALASLSQNGYGLGPYCMSVQCGRVGNPPANHRKATKDFENQEKFRDPGLVRFGSASPIDGGSIGPENLTLTKGPPLPSSGRFRQSLSDQRKFHGVTWYPGLPGCTHPVETGTPEYARVYSEDN